LVGIVALAKPPRISAKPSAPAEFSSESVIVVPSRGGALDVKAGTQSVLGQPVP
jgi:hypothetical protein